MRRLPARSLRSEHGQTAAEYIGMILVVAVIIGAIVTLGIGGTITQRIEDAICSITPGADCGEQRAADEEPCRIRSTISSDNLTVGLDIKVFSGGAGGERAVVKEEFDDGTARYTIVDKAALELALGTRGGTGPGIGGIGSSLTAALAAQGELHNASIFTTRTAQQTRDVDEALRNAGGVEGAIRGGENGLDTVANLPGAAIEGLAGLLGADIDIPDVPDIDGWLIDRVLGGVDLPEPDSVAIGGEIAAELTGSAEIDQGPSEVGAGAALRAARGGLHFTSGDRKGETEFYFQVSGSAGAELKSALLGEANAGAAGTLTLTLVVGANGLPKALRVNGLGTATALNEIGSELGLSAEDLRELAVDSDRSEGKSVEFSADLALDGRLGNAALDILRDTPRAGLGRTGADLAQLLLDNAAIEYGVYDATTRENTTGVNAVVASLTSENAVQVNVLDSLFRKAPGGSLQRIECAS